MNLNRQLCKESEPNLQWDGNMPDQAPSQNICDTTHPSSTYVAFDMSKSTQASTSTYYAHYHTRSPPMMVTPTAPFGSIQNSTTLAPVIRNVVHDQFDDASDDEDISSQLQRVGRRITTPSLPAKFQEIDVCSPVLVSNASTTAPTGSSSGLDALALAAAVSTTNKEENIGTKTSTAIRQEVSSLSLYPMKTSVNSCSKFYTVQEPSMALSLENNMYTFMRTVSGSPTGNLVSARVVSDDFRTETLNNKAYAGDLVDSALESINDSPLSTQIRSNDVLCGRGGLTNHHQGNVFFRNLVRSRQKRYLEASKRDKSSVARDIVDTIRKLSPPGRFLKKDSMSVWVEIGNRKAREKTSQALREGAPELRDELTSIPDGQAITDNSFNITAADNCNSTQVAIEGLSKIESQTLNGTTLRHAVEEQGSPRVVLLDQSQFAECAPVEDRRTGLKRQKTAPYTFLQFSSSEVGGTSKYDDEGYSFCRSQETKRCFKKRISDRMISSTV